MNVVFKTIGIFAHVDAGKTTVAESMLYVTNQIKKQGRVDHQDAVLDYHDLERKRGITIFSDVAGFQFENTTFQLIDTPGHLDFAYEMEQAINVLDAAIIVVSGVDGIQAHTRTVFSLLEAAHVPIFFFINKMDRLEADLTACVTEIATLTDKGVSFSDSDSSWIEEVASLDEDLLELYFEEGYDELKWQQFMQMAFMNQTLYPICHGSGLKNEGITALLSLLNQLCVPTFDVAGDVSGHVFTIRHDQKQPLTFVKLTQGILNVKDELQLHRVSDSEKIHQIRRYLGAEYETVSTATAGEVVALVGLTDVRIGDGFGDVTTSYQREIMPTLKVSVHTEEVPKPIFLSYLQQLERENPTLNVSIDAMNGEISVRVLGLIAIEILQDIMLTRFMIHVTFGSLQIVYAETIADSIIGSGHYEPLKHYAEVHVRLRPLPRGSGVTFASVCSLDDLPKQAQNLIQTHVFERPLIGILTGSVLTDVEITLLTGRGHEKHTSGGDFREATHRAIRQALEKATNVLLEPMYEVKLTVLTELLGRVLHDLQLAKGRFEAPIVDETYAMIEAIVPVATFMDYPKVFASFTKGQGELQLKLAGYEPCHNEADVIAHINYDKEADRENPSGSIFCAKGSGFVVPWDEADHYMHCEVNKYE